MKNKDIKSLYIHIPFCESLCDYCDFTKLQYFRKFARKYLDSLKIELDSYQIHDNLETIYIGGGTPTSLEDDLFEELLMMIFPYTKSIKEYTVECNPESLSEIKLQLMKKYNVNRLSIGVESTNDQILKNINRKHTVRDVKKAINNARKYEFNNINVDLIIGLPHVSKQLFIEDLINISSLDVDHISCYSLTVHENTKFFINKINEPDEEYSRLLYDTAESFLKEKGYVHYEISNWSKPNKHSLHNLTYWKDEEYYGLGLGASGYIKGARYTNTKNLEEYNAGKYIKEKEYITNEENEEYFIMLNLRTTFGINLNEYHDMFETDFYTKYQKILDNYINEGFLVLDQVNGIIKPTYQGMMILDKIILDLVS